MIWDDLKYWFECIFAGFKPHQRIADQYLDRWWIIPRNRFFNVYLHHYTGDDPGEHPHDHPWNSISILLKGSYIEELYYVDWTGFLHHGSIVIRNKRFSILRRSATWIHRQQFTGEEAWTLFMTGPKHRKWCFWVDGKPIYWKDYLGIEDDRDYEKYGRQQPPKD